MLRRAGLEAIAVGDRGPGRKELVIRLAGRERELVFRMDPDITAIVPEAGEKRILDQPLARHPCLSEVSWRRRQEATVHSLALAYVEGTLAQWCWPCETPRSPASATKPSGS